MQQLQTARQLNIHRNQPPAEPQQTSEDWSSSAQFCNHTGTVLEINQKEYQEIPQSLEI